jgi:hypothetical protein
MLLINNAAAQSHAPSKPGILENRVPDCFRAFIELPAGEFFVSIEQSFLFSRLINRAALQA